MNNKLQQFLQDRAAAIGRMRAILDLAEDEKRDMTTKENEEYKALDASIDKINEAIKREEKLLELESRITGEGAPRIQIINQVPERTARPTIQTRARDIQGYVERSEQLPPEDFFKCLFNRDFGPLKDYRAESRGVVLGTGAAGGFAVPQIVVTNTIDRLLTDQGIFARIGKEFVEPGTGDTLHAVTFENCEIDSHGLFGFSKPTFVAEGGTIPEGTPRLVKRTWELKKLAMGTRISIEASVAGPNLQTKVEEAMAGALKWGLEYYIVQGSGVNEPVGLVNSSCMYQHGRAAASQVAFADVTGMFAKTRLENNCWIASQEVLPQLIGMTDAGTHSVFLPGQGQTGAAMPVPNTLFGAPLLTNMGASPGLGEKGDICFCSDLSFYKATLWQGLIIRASDGPYWSTGEIGIQVIMLLDAGALPVNQITVDSQTYGWGTVLV